MSKSHINSKISLLKTPIPISSNTSLMCHFDVSTTDTQGISPITDTSGLSGITQFINYDSSKSQLTASYQGKYGGCALIGSSTTNVIAGNFDTTFDSLADGDTVGFTNQLGTGNYLGVSSARNYGGGKSLKVNNGVGGTGRIFRTTPIALGEVCCVSAWVYSTVAGAKLHLEWSGGNYNWAVAETYNVHDGNGWQFLYSYVTATATSATTCYYFFYPGTNSVDTYIDNIQLEKKSYPTFYINGTRSSNAYITYPSYILNKDEGTISFWLKYNVLSAIATGGNTENPLFSNGGTEGNDAFDLLFGTDSTYGRFYYRKYQGATNAQVTYSFSSDMSNQWTMITCTWKHAQFMKLYINGVNVSTATTNVDFTTLAGNFNIGYGIRSTPNFMIDELRVDNIAQSDEEIKTWFISQRPFYAIDRYKLVR